MKKIKLTETQYKQILREFRGPLLNKKNLSEGIRDSWSAFVTAAKREGKESVIAAKILRKLLSGGEVTREEISFLKSQSADIAKIVGVMSLGAVSMAIPIALEKILNRWDISIMPKAQSKEEEQEEEISENYITKKKILKEGIGDFFSDKIKNIQEKSRLKTFTPFEKQIYFYQKGYDKIEKRLKQYINDFRYYYNAVHKQSVRNLTNKEILKFLTKHYYEDIIPTLSGLFKNKILSHGSNDLTSLDIIDIDQHIGSGSKNKGHYGKGFYLTSSRKAAKHYGLTQPIVLNDIHNPFYIIPGDESYYDAPDFEGMDIRVRVNLADLPEEERKNFSHELKSGNPYYQVAHAQGVPKLDKSWKQNGIKDAKKDLAHKLENHYKIGNIAIKKLLDDAEITIKELPGFAGLIGSKVVDNAYDQGKYDLIVTNKNTSGVGANKFMDAEVVVKDPTQVVSLFPNYNLITMSDLSSINRDLTNPAIHNESEEKKGKILYSAVILDEDSRDKLLALMRLCADVPEDWKRLAHHMTIVFKEGLPEELKGDLNENVILTVKSIGISDDAIAVGVEGYPSTKDNPHITLAIPPNGKPANSNYIEDWRDVEAEILLRGKVSEIRTHL